MTDQTLSLMPANGRLIVERAKAEHKPAKTFALFSGGGDSAVLTDWAHTNGLIDAAVFIDTGTAVPGVRDYAEHFCEVRNIPFLTYAGRPGEYRRLVLERGFPGPAAHLYAYVRLKERALDALMRDQKASRSERIMLLTGVRRYESGVRKMGRVRPAYVDPTRSTRIWVAPLIDWTNDRMAAYKERYNIRPSDPAALLHRSGECNCGAFAAPGEREMLRSLWPAWFEETIGTLEREAEACGVPCVWGERPPYPELQTGGPVPAMCSDCQLRLDAA